MSSIKYVFVGNPHLIETLNDYPETTEEAIKQNSLKIFNKYCSTGAINSKINLKSKVVFDEGKYFFKVTESDLFVLVFCDSSTSEAKAFAFIAELENVQALSSRASKKQIKQLLEKFENPSNVFKSNDFGSSKTPLENAQNEINNLTTEMKKNVDNIIINLNTGSGIEEKSAKLKDSSLNFKQKATELRKLTCRNNMKIAIVLSLTLVSVLIMLYLLL